MGMRMPGWYDVPTLGDLSGAERSTEDERGIMRSQAYVHELIQTEARTKDIPSHRIVLGGFSQGGSLSILAGLTCPQRLGGIFALSSYLLLRAKVRDLIPADGGPNRDTPIFMGHGDADPLVRYEWGVMAAERLRDWGWKVRFETYEGLPHSASPQEIDDLETWLAERLPPLGDGGSQAPG